MSEKKTRKGAPVPENKFSQGAFDAMLERMSGKASEGDLAPKIRRREASIEIDHTMCEPGSFSAPIKIGMSSVSAGDEMDALTKASNDTTIGFELAKAGIRSVNGRKLAKHEVDLLWEVLGFGGRTAVAAAFIESCSGMSEEKLGKSLRTVEIS